MVAAIPTLSTADTEGQVTGAVLRFVLVLRIRLAGQVMLGRVVSIMVIAYEHEAVLPAASHALHVMVVEEPKVKMSLDGPPVQLVALTPTLSTAGTVRDQRYTDVGPPAEATSCWAAGQVTRGGSLSRTLMVVLQLAGRPLTS